MLQSTILHNASPEDFLNQIVSVFRKEIEDLKQNFQPKQPEDLLTRDEVAKLLKIDLSSVHNWSKKGILKRYAIGGRIYFKRSEIDESLISY
ncbi:helix-turn-helix domain-containing protein [uncultured Christiangramia sp.]|uniref:helix-turn-helix domain-containing protein n=1 Tax=uncultured Christiangramia sp. TaxID=503836 RepID=UPI002626CEFA|nr:helix-turn-helix domain-containing protein [uncultured Christiangramia sp.]